MKIKVDHHQAGLKQDGTVLQQQALGESGVERNTLQTAASKNYLLGVLLAILTCSYVDRLALGLLLQDIKIDLSLSDTQLGFLSGIAFAFFYSIMGIPIARWADRGNRVTIVSVTISLWSAAVAVCAAASSFLQLLASRVFVAVGEAGCIPPAHSLIADYFTRRERPRAFAIYMMGGAFSYVIGYFIAGWLNESYGWRLTFVLLGLPGLPLALLAWLTLKEPRLAAVSDPMAPPRRESLGIQEASLPLTIKEVVAALWHISTFRHLLGCLTVVYFFSAGIGKWQPTFFVRSYGVQTGELGTWFAAMWGIGSLIGTYCGGKWATRYAAKNERLQLQVVGIVYCVCGIISACIYLSPSLYLAYGLMGVAAAGISVAYGPLFAAIQSMVPDRMRATSIALIFLIANLVGMGLGPLAAGLLSDVLRPEFGEESLRYALLALCPGYFWGGWHLWKGSETVQRDLDRAHERA